MTSIADGRHRGAERRARSRARTRSGRSARTASISRSRSRTCSAARADPGRARGVPRGADHAVGDRPARGPRPRLRRTARVGHRPRRSTSPTRRSRGSSTARSADPLFTAGSVRTPEGHLAFVYKTAAEIGELGDNTARLRAQIRDDELLHLALRADDRAGVRARAHALGEHRHHLRGQRAPAEPGGDRRRRRVDSSRAYTIAALNGDVDNYADLKALDGLHFPAEITTDAKVIPALVARRLDDGRRSRRGVPLDGRVVRGVGRDRAAVGRRSRLPAARAAGKRPGVVRRARARRVRRRERAVRPRRRVRLLPAPRRRDDGRSRQPGEPGPGRGARPAARGNARRRAPAVVRRARVARRRGRPAGPADHDPRRRPRRRAALSPEGDHRGARVVPQDAARQDRRTRRAARRAPARGDDARRRARRAALGRDPARARDRPGHRGHRGPEPRAGAARRDRRESRHHGGDARDRALGLRPRTRHERHARRGDVAIGHDHRHEPHRRSRRAPAARS